MWEDEKAIGKGYKRQGGITIFLIAAAFASTYLDLKLVIVVAAALMFGAVTFCEARLYDLCIRLKRSNHIAHENGARLAQIQDSLSQLNTRVFHIVNALDLEEKSAEKSERKTEELTEKLRARWQTDE
jgi:hypothetical protein